jgi:hypothetical protein
VSPHLRGRSASPAAGRVDRLVRFSFRYLDTSHPAFAVRSGSGDYFRRLLARLRDLSELTVEEFTSSRSTSLRIHRIHFTDPRVAEKGFNIRGQSEADEKAWQFAVSANEHGRVHGFLYGNTFFIRWLDPEHNLYPG